jgi:hypothetical protein
LKNCHQVVNKIIRMIKFIKKLFFSSDINNLISFVQDTEYTTNGIFSNFLYFYLKKNEILYKTFCFV